MVYQPLLLHGKDAVSDNQREKASMHKFAFRTRVPREYVTFHESKFETALVSTLPVPCETLLLRGQRGVSNGPSALLLYSSSTASFDLGSDLCAAAPSSRLLCTRGLRR